MIDALIQFALFLAEAIIVVITILIIVGGVTAIITKGKMKERARITIRKLNKYYTDLANALNDVVLSKAERKKLSKEKKKDTKKSKKKSASQKHNKQRVFIMNFSGDIKASAVNNLREEITAILTIAKPTDEVVLRLESAGGFMHSYGLAASQLQRIKDQAIPLTVCVDKTAASGGYMMACVANKILAAPFAIIGSVGILAQIPNFHRLLKKNNIDFEQISAGKYKRTLSVFGENTRDGRKKFKQEIEEAHVLFKNFVKTHRDQVNIDKIATGEHWFATQALDFNLVDELSTSDDYLLKKSKDTDLYEIVYQKKKKMIDRLSHSAHAAFGKIFSAAKEEAEEKLFL